MKLRGILSDKKAIEKNHKWNSYIQYDNDHRNFDFYPCTNKYTS